MVSGEDRVKGLITEAEDFLSKMRTGNIMKS